MMMAGLKGSEKDMLGAHTTPGLCAPWNPEKWTLAAPRLHGGILGIKGGGNKSCEEPQVATCRDKGSPTQKRVSDVDLAGLREACCPLLESP